MKTKFPLLLLAVIFFTISSCVKEGADVEYNYYDKDAYEEMKKVLNLPSEPLPYVNNFPSYYTSGSVFPFNKDLATLGRVIFYDKALSSDGTVSCASCHDQAAAFADNKQFSDGVEGQVTERNSLALGSVFSFQEYYGHINSNRVPFFWDNRANNVQDQSKETFANEKEMNMKMHEVVAAVNSKPYYRALLNAVNNTTDAADEYIVLEAISIFINSISSYNSKYDQALSRYFDENQSLDGIETAEFPDFSPIENKGKNFYIANCGSCHGNTNGFPGELMANNGLDLEYADEGMGNGEFKVPTLRNINLTAPYMHDGRFATIDEVLNHYSGGIKNHTNLSSVLRGPNNAAQQIEMTAEDREALKAFFNTFHDDDILTAEKYSDPFIQ